MSASISAEEIQKMITGNSTEQYIGGAGGHSPILDLVNRLSGQLNQQTAESNLYRGGAGYGGSFQSADQKAARAAGGTLNAKPYGGWGGYGSQNPTMTNQPLGGGGTDTYVPPWTGGNTVPPDIPIDDGGGGQAPIDDPSVPPDYDGELTPDNATPMTTPGTKPPVFAPDPGQAPVTSTTPNPYGAFAGNGGATPVTWGGNLKPGDPGWNPAWVGGGPSGGFAGGYNGGTFTGGGDSTNVTADPHTASAVAMSAAQANGNANNASASATVNPYPKGSQQWYEAEMAKLPAEGTPERIAYDKQQLRLQAESQGNVFNEERWDLNQQAAGLLKRLGALGLEQPKGGAGGMITDEIANALAAGVPMQDIEKHYVAVIKEIGPDFHEYMHGALVRLDPAKLKDGTQTAQTLTNGIGDQYANYKAPDLPADFWSKLPNKPGLGKDGGSTGGNVTTGGGAKSGLVADGAAAAANAKGDAEVPTTGGGGVVTGDPFYVPPPGTPGNTDTSPRNVSIKVPSGGKNWGPRDTPPQGMKWGDYYEAGNGRRVVFTREGRYAPVNIEADGTMSYSYYTDPDNNSAVPVLNTPNPGARPVIGGKAIVGYTMDGQPIYNEDGMFEQGANADGIGDTTPDAWSTSPDWRPEEPTGGLYGAYTQMAGGQLTDYENAIGNKWRDLSENPATADDTDYKNMLAEYNKTPGKGIDEAYGAYNEMINSNGYSDAEKGAMEGSAVRGISTGFQRGADEIRRQGARTNNRASAYAALGNAGAAYGADLGETNRQNQIKFADEAQRRKEAGASGMTNVAGLSNTRSQFGISAAGEYAKEMARRKEAGIAGMGDFATYGRGLQSQGLAGLSEMLKQSNSDKNNTYAQIAALLGTNVGQSSGGTSKTNSSGFQAGV